jgi:hypothetical protein
LSLETFFAVAGRVAIISAADGRFLCAEGAASFSSPRCLPACQFFVTTLAQELDKSVSVNSGPWTVDVSSAFSWYS